jgi:6-phosphogluconolactonase
MPTSHALGPNPPRVTGSATVARRTILTGAAAGSAVLMTGLQPEAAVAGTRRDRLIAYIGSRTTVARNARGVGITVWRVGSDGRPWQLIQTVPADDGNPDTDAPAGAIPINPSFLILSADGRHLYTVHGDDTRVSAFTVAADGRLTHLNTVDVGRRNPVHLTFDPTGRWLIVAFLAVPGSVVSLAVEPDGRLGAVGSILELPGTPGPHKTQQVGSNPHHVVFDPSRRWLAICDRGYDRIFIARFDATTGALTLNDPGWTQTREIEGPRHIAFHPTRSYAWVINELRSTVTSYRWDATDGILAPLQVVASQPPTMTGDTRGAEIAVDRTGRYLYASNRSGAGDNTPGGPDPDTIGIFEIHRDGHLEPVRWVSTEGIRPRFFSLDPAGRRLFAANEVTDTIVGFDLAGQGHKLRSDGIVARTGSPVTIAYTTATRP